VGIGSATPVGILDVGDNRLSSQTYFRNNGSYGSGGGGQTTLNVMFGGVPIAVISNTGTGQRDGHFRLLDENVTKVSITANASRGGPTYFNGGNVGIGTTNPQTILDVRSYTAGTAIDSGVTLWNPSGANDTPVGIRLSTYGDETGNQYPKQFIGAIRDGAFGAGKGSIVFCNRNAADTSVVTLADERMRILPSGNVGIGTTTPGAKLTVMGNVQGWNGTTAKYADAHHDFYQNGYNSGVGNSNYTLFYYAYDHVNWNYQWIKVIVKRGYYYASGEAAYMINCQNGAAYELYNQQANTSTASFSFSNNTINANRRVTTVTFVSPNTYMTWGFKIETFGIYHETTATSTPSNGNISFS